MIIQFPSDKVEKVKKKKEAEEFLSALENSYKSHRDYLSKKVVSSMGSDINSTDGLISMVGDINSLYKTALKKENLEVALGSLQLLSSIHLTLVMEEIKE